MTTIQISPSSGFWLYEESGLLAVAVQTYLNSRTNPPGSLPEPTAEQIRLIGYYFDQWMRFPWRCAPEDKWKMDALCQQAPLLSSPEQIHDWLERALDLGIDPL